MVSAILEIRGLGKREWEELSRQARSMGLTREEYVKGLLEERLEIAREARTKTFAELTGTGGEVDEAELDKLVERARERNHQQTRRKRPR